MDAIFKRVINLCANNQNSKPKSDSGGSILLEDFPIKDLFGLIEQHKSYVAFLKENNMMNAVKKRIYSKIIMMFLK